MANADPWSTSPASRMIDYAFLAVCLTIFVLEASDVLRAVPDRYLNQHWRACILSFAMSTNILSRLSTQLAAKRSFLGLSAVSIIALFVLMFR
jgi:hypothetical protein